MRRIGIVVLCLVSLVGLASLVYAATTLSAATDAVAKANQDVLNQQNIYKSAAANITASSNSLAAMPAFYATLYADVAEAATAQPTSSWPDLNRHLADLAAEFTLLQPKVDAAKQAFAAIETFGAEKVKAALDGIK